MTDNKPKDRTKTGPTPRREDVRRANRERRIVVLAPLLAKWPVFMGGRR